MEIWISVKGFEGVYEISNHGRVRSVDRINVNSKGVTRTDKGKTLKLVDRGNEYLFVSLSKNNKKYNFSIHIGVAVHFVPNPENKPEVNHKDGNKQNNHWTNLEWSTSSENSIHAYENNLRFATKGESHGLSKLTESQVLEIRSLAIESTYTSIADLFGVSRSAVALIVKRDRWKHI